MSLDRITSAEARRLTREEPSDQLQAFSRAFGDTFRHGPQREARIRHAGVVQTS